MLTLNKSKEKERKKQDLSTWPEGLLSFSDKAEKVSREAPFVFMSMRIARSSSLMKEMKDTE